jgi:hypothetical protein
MIYLPLSDQIKTSVVGKVPVSVDWLKVDWKQEPDLGPALNYNNEYRAEVRIGYNIIAPVDVEEYVRKRAVKEITHHVYGPIVHELYEILTELRWMGSSTKPVMKRIHSILEAIDGNH